MREDNITQSRLMRTTFRELMKGVATSIPGHVLTFDPVSQLAQVKVGIQRVDLNGATFEVDPIIQVPVFFPGDDDCLEFKVSAGCEGWILFSQRCIDGWLQSGGVAPNPIGRFHDMTDAAFLPGMRPIPGAITAFANNGIRLRNGPGNVWVWVKDDDSISISNGPGVFTMLPGGEVVINGVRITTAGDVITPAGISLNQHRHSAVQSGPSISGGPVV